MNQKGISPILIILIIVGVLVAAGGVWYWQSQKGIQDPTFKMVIVPMVGGGFAGAISSYSINSTGEVYRSYSQTWSEPPKAELIKRINQNTLRALRDSLIKTNIFGMTEGVPEYGGQNWTVTINSQTKTVHFTEIPKNLLKTEKILEKILERE